MNSLFFNHPWVINSCVKLPRWAPLARLLPWESLCSTSHLGGFGEGGCDVDEVDVDDVDEVDKGDVDDVDNVCDVDEVDEVDIDDVEDVCGVDEDDVDYVKDIGEM